MTSGTIAILTASSGLGSFVPAVALSKWFQRQQRSVRFYALEQLYTPQALVRLEKTKAQCRRSLRTALLTQRWLSHSPGSIRKAIDADKWQAFKAQWQHCPPEHVFLFSGFWLSFISELQAAQGARTTGENQPVYHGVHVDVTTSLSWQPGEIGGLKHHHLLAEGDEQFLVPPPPVVDWAQRESRVAVHGGGWDIGDLDACIAMLRSRYTLLLGQSSLADADADADAENWQLLTEPDWLPWQHGCVAGGQYPAQTLLGQTETRTGEQSRAINARCPDEPPFQQLLSRCRALITKPGGASLIDSMATATPLVLLPPFGDYEAANGRAWISRGFALSFDDWKAQGFAQAPLYRCHQALLAMRGNRSVYGEKYANEDATEVG
ncbi:hypothetical protein [Photobacterium sp. TY1-4]|uniref:hypothetical protein n=1 Tax=Photobacterium sp. TY1-4 TaxID=2899122 RepID=UPI0021C10533|nr:hypothetical protein [Photobacterium sp. TY1-4]UXI00494.1 hypothetical protein NH461_11800 [Photobacterium sp. TY1-4]